MAALELIGVPRNLWVYVLLLAFPGTMAAVVLGATVEHFWFAQRPKNTPETK
jgi:hypothetical protein